MLKVQGDLEAEENSAETMGTLVRATASNETEKNGGAEGVR